MSETLPVHKNLNDHKACSPPVQAASYSIRDLEQISGIKAHTLRIWEQRYGILAPRRTDTNIRLYDDSDLRSLLNISLLNANGYRISKIACMSPESVQQEVMAITESKCRCCDQQQALISCMLELDEDRFEKVLSNNIMNCGLDRTMTSVIFPLLQRIAALWQTGSVSRAHENFVRLLVRQKLIVAIDGQTSSNRSPSAGKFMLCLPDSETSENGLLFAHYLLRLRKQRSVYTGRSLSPEDLQSAYDTYRPDCIVCVSPAAAWPAEFLKYAEGLGRMFPESRVVLVGHRIDSVPESPAENVIILNSFEDFIGFMDSVRH
ncbi:MAG: MerR family transcriptional regulator [Bacteroidota bacterium]